MPRWDGEAEHVGERPRVSVGDVTRDLENLRAENGLWGDDLAQRGKRADMLSVVDPGDQEAVDVAAGEPDLDADARHRGLVEPARDEVVERPVEVRQGEVDRDACDRLRRRDGV